MKEAVSTYKKGPADICRADFDMPDFSRFAGAANCLGKRTTFPRARKASLSRVLLNRYTLRKSPLISRLP